VLVPFMLALASKSDSLPLSALGAVQRMISHDAIAPQRLPSVTLQLIARAQLPSADESSLLKVLQTVLTIASSPALLHSDTTVSQLLLLCFTLQQSRSPTIKNTASATVQQFVALLLDCVVAEDDMAPAANEEAPGSSAPTQSAIQMLSVAARCAYLAVHDLCLLANGEPALWLPALGPVSVTFALEVVQRTLQSHRNLFIRMPPFRYLLRERACALVLKTLQQPQQEWPVALRLAHLTSTLLSSYAAVLRTECEILLSMLARMAASEAAPICQRALALEACRVVASDPHGLRALFTAYDMAPKSSGVFSTFVTNMCGLLKSPAVNFALHAELIEAHFLRHHRSVSSARAAAFNIALYSESDGAHLTNDYAAALAVESQVFIARAIGTIGEALRASGEGDHSGGGVASNGKSISPAPVGKVAALVAERKAATKLAEMAIVREMVGACWKPLLGALALLMARFGSEEAIQAVLKCYQAFTQACAALELPSPRDAFLASLCQYALPPRSGGELRDSAGAISFAPVDTAYEPLPHTRLSAKNVQALKAVFNIAHCMGGLLGTSWNLILNTLEQLDRIISSSKTTTTGGDRAVERAVATGGPDATSNELAILSAALNNLFSASTRLDDAAIAHFLTALSTQSFASLAHEATSKEKLATPGSAAAQPTRLFALNKFVETVLLNLDRVPVFWPLVTQFLLPVANHQTQRIRILGVESLSKVLVAAMRLYLSHQEVTPITTLADAPHGLTPEVSNPGGSQLRWPSPKEGDGSWDRVLLAPLEELQRRCAYRETQERILSATHEVLQACGAGLAEGWLLLLSILYRAATKPSLKGLVPLAFRSVELIASDFLSFLPVACVPAYVEVAAAYATQADHLNVSLTAIGLQWTICDFLFASSRLSHDDLFQGGNDSAEDDGDDGRCSPPHMKARPNSSHPAMRGSLSTQEPERMPLDEESGGSALATAPRYAHVDMHERVLAHDVWCATMRSVRHLCVDERPEVRTCSMHSFVSIVSSHGHQLSGRSWDHFLQRTLHPLLDEIIGKAQSAPTDEPVAKKLGTEGGRDVMMMLHHSRDTEAKQWDETWVLALDAAARLYRGFMPQLIGRRVFQSGWDLLLAFVQTSLLSLPRSGEVALASISAAHSLMLSSARVSIQGKRSGPGGLLPSDTPLQASQHTGVANASSAGIPIAVPLTSPSRDRPTRTADGMMTTVGPGPAVQRERLPPVLWASVWSMLERAVDLATIDATAFVTHERMLCALLNRSAELYERGRTHFEEADVLRLLQLAERLACPPGRPMGWDPTQPATAPTSQQVAVLSLLSKLPPFHAPTVRDEEMWPLLLWLLLKLLEPPPAPIPASAVSVADTALVSAQSPITGANNGSTEMRPTAGGNGPVGFAQRCHQLLHRLLTEEAGPAAKLAVVEDVLNVLRRVMSWRLHPECACPALPRAAASGFVALLDALLPHLPSPEEGAAPRAHSELTEALWTRLSPPAAASVLSTPVACTHQTPASAQAQVFAQAPLAFPEARPITPVSLGLISSLVANGGFEVEPPPLPPLLPADRDAIGLEGSTLVAARRVLLTTMMKPALRRRLLQMPFAVLSLPTPAAVERDKSWREAAATLCMLSSRAGEVSGVALPADIETQNADGWGGACASLAAPMLVQAAWRVLCTWVGELFPGGASDVPGGVDGNVVVTARAAQIAYLLSLLCRLQLPQGVLPAPVALSSGNNTPNASPATPIAASSVTASAAAAPATAASAATSAATPHTFSGPPAFTQYHSGARDHLLRLAPAIIRCIGEPASVFARGAPLSPEIVELQTTVRHALSLVSVELGLELGT